MVRPNVPLISSVSDTAQWVATYRAWESARADALFKDPFAERLAGEKGPAIARHMPRQARSGWPIVVRTVLIDELITASLAEGCDCVVNLAAGLDARPYRMALPASLTWIEADLPVMIDFKERLLSAESPACRLLRRTVDLAEPGARSRLFAELGSLGSKTLVIAEGLLVYLEAEVVVALARELAACRNVRWWIFDLASPNLIKGIQRAMKSVLKHAPMRFAPSNGVAFFESLGWKVVEVRSQLRAAIRLHRLPTLLRWAGWFPDPNPRKLGQAQWSAVVRLVNGGA